MNLRLVLYTLGNLLLFLVAALCVPLLIGLFYRSWNGESDWSAFAITIGITGAVGFGLRLGFRTEGELRRREGFAVVALGWSVIAFFGALPYYFGNVFAAEFPNPLHELIASYFESISGFTTTGATVLTDIERLPHATLFWRSLTHWLGGMGIVVLAVAILPLLGVGGMQLYRAEAPGPQTDRLTPRIAETAKLLWGVYVLLSAVETLLLLLGGMNLFDALCHTFGTMATGGFSTKNLSIGHYDSVFIDAVVTLFMVLAGTNFALHYRALRGDWRAYFRDTEFRFYLGMLIVAMAVVVWNTMTRGPERPTITIFSGERVAVELPAQDRASIRVAAGERTIIGLPAGEANTVEVIPGTETELEVQIGERVHADEPVFRSFGSALRYASFQVASILTTTGYGTHDFELWPSLSQVLLVMLMFFGGCAGSTGGGMKHVRVLLLIKHGYAEIRRMLFPRSVVTLRLGEQVVSPDVMRNILSFFSLFLGAFAFGSLTLSALGIDLVTSVTATISALGNIGPALGTVGPTDNYAHLPAAAKAILSFLMLLGRLELYTVLVLFAPELWKK